MTPGYLRRDMHGSGLIEYRYGTISYVRQRVLYCKMFGPAERVVCLMSCVRALDTTDVETTSHTGGCPHCVPMAACLM